MKILSLFNNLIFYFKHIKKTKFLAFFGIFCQFINIFISIIVPVFTGKIIDSFSKNTFYNIFCICIVYLFLRILHALIAYVCNIFFNKVYNESLVNLSNDIANSVLKSSQIELENNITGVFTRRITEDTEIVANAINSLFFYALDFLFYIGIFVAILLYNQFAALCIIIMYILILLIEKKRAFVYYECDKEYKKSKENTLSTSTEMVFGSKEIKSLNFENSILKLFVNKVQEGVGKKYKALNECHFYSMIEKFIIISCNFLYIVIIAFFLKNNKLSIVEAIILFNYGTYLGMPVIDIMNSFVSSINEFNVSAERLQEIINGTFISFESFGKKQIDNIKGKIEFQNVTFGYKNKNDANYKDNLKNISFVINPNETVAILGKSGSGKSTIFSLINRIYNNYTGLIKIDDIEISEYDKDSLRNNITSSFQKPYFFNISIEDNLKMVKPNASNIEIENACKEAGIHEIIIKKPNGYDTILKESGIGVAGGQIYKLALARLILKNSKIVLCDEITASLDDESKSYFYNTLKKYKGKHTILFITHTKENALLADRILFVDKGKVIKEVSKEELHFYISSNP